jgi:hypothetical protein
MTLLCGCLLIDTKRENCETGLLPLLLLLLLLKRQMMMKKIPSSRRSEFEASATSFLRGPSKDTNCSQSQRALRTELERLIEKREKKILRSRKKKSP